MTPSVRSILVALDESARAPVVFEAAVMMARSLGAHLILIRVLVIPPDIPPAARTYSNGLEVSMESAARADLLALINSSTGVEFGPPIISDGEPWRSIVSTAHNLDVDLIVVGSHRHHGPLYRALGTVASKVVNHADRNVLVVHQRGVSRESAG